MSTGKVVAIYIAPEAGAPMRAVSDVRALEGQGLEGDRYCSAQGSYNKGKPGNRQVTLINALFFPGTDFFLMDSRRNLIVEGVELMWLIGREFQVGEATMRGVKYCDPCERPNTLSDNPRSFREAFFDRGGLVASVLKSGVIKVGSPVVPPPRNY